MDIEELKSVIRSILFSLGSSATERDFRKVYSELYGNSFNEVLRIFNASFFQLMVQIPDVCRAFYNFEGEVFIQRVSTEDAAHLDGLTINRRKRSRKVARPFIRSSGSYRSGPPGVPFRGAVRNPVFTRSRPVQPSFPSTSYNRAAPVNFSRPPPSFRPSTSFPRNNRNYPQSAAYQRVPTTPIANLGSERVVYNSSTASIPREVAQQVVAERVDLHFTASKPNLGAERVVYKPNERVCFDGTEVQVQKKNANTWNDSGSIRSSSSTRVAVESSGSNETFITAINEKESVDKTNGDIQDVVKKFNILRLSKDEESNLRTVVCDKETSIKVTITNPPLSTPPPAAAATRSGIKAPNELKLLLTRNRARLFGNSIENTIKDRVLEISKKTRADEQSKVMVSKIPAADDYLQSFVTDEAFRIPLPELSDKPRFFHIKVIDISSPTNFTFQFNLETLSALTAKMKELYESLENQIFYRVKVISQGMIVAVNHRSKWFRAQIVSVNQEDASVLPLDCMKLKPKTIAINNIFYLHKSFSAETQKSALGCIYGLKRIEDEKLALANDELVNFAEKSIATVKKLRGNVFHLNIADLAAKTNLIDTLKKKKLALLDEDNFQDNEDFLYVSLK